MRTLIPLFLTLLATTLSATGIPEARAEEIYTAARLDVLIRSMEGRIVPAADRMAQALAPGYQSQITQRMKERYTYETMKASFVGYLSQNLTDVQAGELLAWLSGIEGKDFTALDARAFKAVQSPEFQSWSPVADETRDELVSALIEQREQLTLWVEMTVGLTREIFQTVNDFQPETIPQARIDETVDDLRANLANQLRPTFERAYRYASRETSMESLGRLVGAAQTQLVIEYQNLITAATRHVYENSGN